MLLTLDTKHSAKSCDNLISGVVQTQSCIDDRDGESGTEPIESTYEFDKRKVSVSYARNKQRIGRNCFQNLPPFVLQKVMMCHICTISDV